MIATMIFAVAAMTVLSVLGGIVASDGRRIAALLTAAVLVRAGQPAPVAVGGWRRTRA